MIARRRFLIGGTCALVSSACTDEPPQNASVEERIAHRASQLSGRTLRVLYPKGSRGNVEPVAREFRRLTRKQIELVEASLDEISAEVLLASQIGLDRFDVALPATFGIPDLVEAGAIAPLDELAAAHEPRTLMNNAIYTLGDRYKGTLYGYQTDGDAYLMFYNGDWLEDEAARARYEDRYGTALTVPLTWNELDRQLAFFHQPAQNRFGGSLFRTKRYAAWEFWVRLHANGRYPVCERMQPCFSDDAARDALESLIAASANLHRATRTDGLFENFAAFGRGNSYANIGWGGTQKYLKGPRSRLRNVTHSVLPGGEFDGRALTIPYFNWGWNYVVAANSPQRELAYLFILFASTPRISTLSVQERSGYFDPFRTEHYASDAVEAIYGRSFLDAHRASLEGCIPDFYLRGQGRYFAALREAVHMALNGQVSVPFALQKLDEKWRETTEELGADGQIEQWNLIRASYPEALRAVLR